MVVLRPVQQQDDTDAVDEVVFSEQATRCAVGQQGSFGIHDQFHRSRSPRHNTTPSDIYLVSVRHQKVKYTKP